MEGLLVLCSFAAEIPAYLLGMCMASKASIGRRSTCFLFLLLGSSLLLLSATSRAIMTPNKLISVVSLIVGRCCVAAVFMLLYLYCAEIFPTSVRTSTLGALSAFARIGCIFAPPFAQYVDSRFPQGATLVFALLGFTAALITPITLPETHERPLYDSLDTLEEAYRSSGYMDEFFASPSIRACGAVGRCFCCIKPLVQRCLAIPGDSTPHTFEERGQLWLKDQWRKTGRRRWQQYAGQAHKAAKRVVGKDHSDFVPLQDMREDITPQVSTVIEMEEEIELDETSTILH
eukprot:Protomagalhaensia_sp_Gyna_25__5152@NODE_605_length_3029_cov_7_218060_g468_i0_p2_GENE_NODE_605_length_3029_cov_7_218060_g468_i0NODE_605_length_3029_cov_7_218060_g468_i0_p2_ORF_typecomplete_len325_score34_55Sugar_tr/PF00083_24/3_6e16MFS_1/PF07690_16/3_6e10MFS_3/PF05977_13/0_015MFS_1_like/PF12832_7/3_7MFS_1_like/PF12832_7/1_9_NODE_605_length_3029_cov_7_218060_g468_i020532919